MHALRASPTLIRLILAWFVLTLGVATASPMVSPTTMHQVCSEGGVVMLLIVDENGRALEADPHALDCPLCLPTSLPAVFQARQTAEPHQLLAHVLLPVQQALMAIPAGAPLPARGPPLRG